IPSGALVLKVSVKRVESTGLHPGCGEGCIPFHHWYRYDAEVERVVVGTWDGSRVQFVHLQHGEYIPAVTDDCHVVLVKASPELEAATGASHVAERILSPRFKLDREVIRAWGDGR